MLDTRLCWIELNKKLSTRKVVFVMVYYSLPWYNLAMQIERMLPKILDLIFLIIVPNFCNLHVMHKMLQNYTILSLLVIPQLSIVEIFSNVLVNIPSG